jgi:transposase
MEFCPMRKPNDMSKCLAAFDQDSTLVAVIELGLQNWLVAGIVPGIERHPLKKMEINERALIELLYRWRDQARKAGHPIKRICVAFEAGRDGFWLARWLRSQGIECYVIHPTSVCVSREHRRAKTDRLDAEVLKRAFIGWLRGETDHCSMAAIPTLEEEDAKRPSRERETLIGERTRIINRVKACFVRLGIRGLKLNWRRAADVLAKLRTPEGKPIPPNTLDELKRDLARLLFVSDQIKEIEKTRLARLRTAPKSGPAAMVRILANVLGNGVETADMLVHEVFSRKLRDHRAVARYAGLTGSPDESGKKRREKGLAKSGNARVRRGMIQLAWRFLWFQPTSDLAKWYEARTSDGRKDTRKRMIVALARKLLISLWRLATLGEIPAGVVMRAAA